MGRSTSTKATEAESRTDIYQRVTDRIVAAIEAGLAEGKAGMPWHRKSHGGTATGLPMKMRRPMFSPPEADPNRHLRPE
jgi:antirestriction protein ArdC